MRLLNGLSIRCKKYNLKSVTRWRGAGFAQTASCDYHLNGEDRLRFDFGAPYQKTYIETLYGLELVDYRRLPLHFERYSPADQARIANCVVAILKAAQAGVDLETGPFPAEELPLAEALAQLQLTPEP